MAKYTNGTETVDAIAWTGDFSLIVTFLQDNPPILDPKITEDDPSAIGVVEREDGTLAIFVGGDEVYQNAHVSDMLIRGSNLHLRTSDATTFAASFTPIP